MILFWIYPEQYMCPIPKKMPRNGADDMKIDSQALIVTTRFWFVDNHQNHPYQRRNTNYAVHNGTGNGGRAKNKRHQVKAKYSYQPPVYRANYGQRYQYVCG